MHLASSTKHVLLALGIGVSLGACGTDTGTPDMAAVTYTWAKVSADMKTSCASATACHLKGTTQPFSYDGTLTAGSDMANFAALMAVTPALIDKSNPGNSMLILIGKGGMFNGTAHSPSLTATKATSWTAWIAAGAAFQ